MRERGRRRALYLTGDANDYVGKGMAGGLIAIRPPVVPPSLSHKASIIGNTCLWARSHRWPSVRGGRAGERFSVKPGAITVGRGGIANGRNRYDRRHRSRW